MLKVALLTSAFIISSFNSVPSKGINDKPIFSKHSFNHPSRISDASFNNPSLASSNKDFCQNHSGLPLINIEWTSPREYFHTSIHIEYTAYK